MTAQYIASIVFHGSHESQRNTLLSFQSMTPNNNISTIVALWPVVIVALGVALTLIWVIGLAWYSLQLLGLA